MAKVPHIIPLPAELTRARNTTQMFNGFVQRYTDRGAPQKVIALSLGIKAPNISNFKNGSTPIPLCRVGMFADTLGLSAEERFDFITTRLIELHGENTDLCLTTVAAWAEEAFAPTGAEATLIGILRRAVAADPREASDILDVTVQAESPKSWSVQRSADSSSWPTTRSTNRRHRPSRARLGPGLSTAR